MSKLNNTRSIGAERIRRRPLDHFLLMFPALRSAAGLWLLSLRHLRSLGTSDSSPIALRMEKAGVAPEGKEFASLRTLTAVTKQSVENSRVSSDTVRGHVRGHESDAAPLPRRVSNQATQHRLIQTKLSVSQPGDRFEQEADRVAAQVMRAATLYPVDQAKVGEQPAGERIQRVCTACDEELQRQVIGDEVRE